VQNKNDSLVQKSIPIAFCILILKSVLLFNFVELVEALCVMAVGLPSSLFNLRHFSNRFQIGLIFLSALHYTESQIKEYCINRNPELRLNTQNKNVSF